MARGAAAKAFAGVAEVAGAAIQLLGDMFGATEITEERVAAAVDARDKAAAQSEIDMARFRADADYRRKVEAGEAQKIEQERQRVYYERTLDERQR